MSGPFGAVRAGFYWPRIEFDASSVIDFDDPAQVRPSLGAERGQSYALSGAKATVNVHQGPNVALRFLSLSSAKLGEIQDWWAAWAGLGKQSVLILDRLASMAGTWEFDSFNLRLTKAVCVTNPLEVARYVPAWARYTLALVFKQDEVGVSP